MNIIMHHAKNQIGLEAVEGRIQKYPDLDLSSLENWISRQEKEDSGTERRMRQVRIGGYRGGLSYDCCTFGVCYIR